MAQDFLTNPSNALFLHPSDNPNNVLVSTLLDGRNFGHWKRAMEVALIGKNKIGFVRGNFIRPDSSTPDSQAQWDRCDNMVLAWIMHATIKNISDSIMFSTTSHEAWKELEQRYGQADGTRIFEVQRELCSIAQNNLSVADYYTEIKKLWDEYNAITVIPHCSCGLECASYKAIQNMIDNQHLMQFLVGLNDVYKTVRGNLLMMRPLPSLSQAYNVILQEEKQRGLSAASHIVNQSAAFHVQVPSGQRYEHSLGSEHTALVGQQRVAYNYNYKPKAEQNASVTAGRSDRKQYFCDHCKIHGHSIQRCFKIHGYPPGHKFYNKNKKIAAAVQVEPDNTEENPSSTSASQVPIPGLTADQYAQLMVLLQKSSSESLEASHSGFMAGNKICLFSSFRKDSWIIDSGASDHISPNLSLFFDVRPILQHCHITMPNGLPAQVKHIGSVKIGPNLCLKDVLHVPDFQFNLLSISKLTRQTNSQVLFSHECCFLRDHTLQKVVVLGKESNGLYYLNTSVDTPIQPNNTKPQHVTPLPVSINSSSLVDEQSQKNKIKFQQLACFSSTELWHLRLRHPSYYSGHGAVASWPKIRIGCGYFCQKEERDRFAG